MQPDQVFTWTSGLLIGIVFMVVGGLWLLIASRNFKHHREWLPFALIMVLGSAFPLMVLLLIEKRHPADGIISYILHKPAEREMIRRDHELQERLRPMMRLYTVVCPPPEIFEPEKAALLREWSAYHRSYLEPAPMGKECFYEPLARPLGIQKPLP